MADYIERGPLLEAFKAKCCEDCPGGYDRAKCKSWAAAMDVEQLSFFTMLAPVLPAMAVCCMDGTRADAAPAESWMKRLVQGGEYVVQVAGHSLVLRPEDGTADDVPAGNKYYHYTIGPRLYAGTFVGRMKH